MRKIHITDTHTPIMRINPQLQTELAQEEKEQITDSSSTDCENEIWFVEESNRILSLNPPDNFPEKDPYRVLVVGDRGVGKTAFMEALQELALNYPASFNECAYVSTKQLYSSRIPIVTGFELKQMTMMEYVYSNTYSKSFGAFITKPHGRKHVMAMENPSVLDARVKKNRVFDEILISEYPSNDIDSVSEELSSKYDRIIIMADYSDINTMRSAQSWASKLKTPKRKTIICVNKCDVQALSIEDDFQFRKASIMNHFSQQCAVEYISVKTRANIGFIYKYM